MSRLILVGCVAAKQPQAAAARDLYVSPLFRKRAKYAEASGWPWGIVSARFGLLWPDRIVEPYEATIDDLADLYRRPQRMAERMWANTVACELRHQRTSPVDEIYGLTIELHAGVRYVDALREALTSRLFEWTLETPVAGLGIGEQLAWYARQLDPRLSLWEFGPESARR